MAQYIDKSALVAEIKKRIKEREEEEKKGWAYSRVKIVECEHILSFIDILEVKEVNLEKEINNYISNNFFGSETVGFFSNRTKEEPNDLDIALVAKHFFELGMAVSNKAQEGEKV